MPFPVAPLETEEKCAPPLFMTLRVSEIKDIPTPTPQMTRWGAGRSAQEKMKPRGRSEKLLELVAGPAGPLVLRPLLEGEVGLPGQQRPRACGGQAFPPPTKGRAG